MAGITRRRLFALTGLAGGAAVVSIVAVDQWPDSSAPGREVALRRLERLGLPGGDADDDVTALGRAVNSESPMSVERVGALVDSGHTLADILARPPEQPPVNITGWLLPDLTAGLAGLIAAAVGSG